MITGVLSRLLFFWFALLILIQPSLSHLDYLLDLTVKSNAEYAAQKAAPAGGVTPELKQEILDNLAAVGFNPAEVTVESTSTMVDRGERIDVLIRAPRLPLFLYRFGNKSWPQEYYAHAVVMSEHVR